MSSRHLLRTLLVIAACGLFATRGAADDAGASAKAATLVDNLKAKDVDVRRGAAIKIRLSDRAVQRTALPALTEALKNDKDGQVRLTVLDTLAALGHEAEPAIPALLHTLRTDYGGQGKEELHQDYRSALVLAAIGKPSVEALRGLLKEKKENVRAEVIMALGRIGPDAESAVAELVPLLGDKNERIRRETTLALGRIGKAAIEPLIAASTGNDANARAGAVESLGLIATRNETIQQAVLKSAADSASDVRAAAVKSLAKLDLPNDRLIAMLKTTLQDESESVRLAGVSLLVDRRALLARMVPDLESLLGAKNDGVARHAAYLLGKTGPEAVSRLLDALARDNTRIDPIAEALAQIGRPAVGRLQQALESPSPRVRRGAALALGQVRPMDPGVVPKLAAGLRDPDVEVRSAFLTAIGLLGARASQAAPAVRTMLKDKSADVRVQAVAILAPAARRDESLVDDFLPLLDDPDTRVQQRSIDAIRGLGPAGRQAISPAIAKLQSPSADVRRAAAELIGSHGQAAAEALPALSALLADSSPDLQTVAAQTVGRLGRAAQPALPKITPLLDSQNVQVREAGVAALGSLELEADALRPHLSRALRDEKSEVRRAALRAIQRLGPQGAIFLPDIILLAGGKESQNNVERSLRRFERRGPEAKSVPELVKLLQSDKEPVRLLASKFLGLAGSNAKDAIPALERLREDPSAQVRKQAEAACERIKSGSQAGEQEGRARKKNAAD